MVNAKIGNGIFLEVGDIRKDGLRASHTLLDFKIEGRTTINKITRIMKWFENDNKKKIQTHHNKNVVGVKRKVHTQ